ncbi:WXG100 family type VII secretion target [Bacillus cereus]|uniref:WXG100 family type VII secretion target n=1 Tax=Bacillus cereus TaxID=1396 RepID=UPI0021000E47|nr:WXG100 family type VII secretion target [Bacillus cereus]
MIKERTKHERLNKDSEKVDNNNYFSTKLNSIVNKTSNSDNHIVFKNSGGLGVEPGKKSGAFAQAFKYETDIQLPKDMDTFSNDLTSFNKIGGEVKGAVVDAGFKVEDFTIHEQLFRAEVKAQFGGGIGVDHDFGKAHIKVGNAEAGFEAKDGHIGIGVKADLVKGEAELKVPLPFTDWKVVVGGEAAYGREAKFGLMNEIDVGLGIGLGVKFGVEKD